MSKVLKHKKVCIAIILLSLLVLAGIIIGLTTRVNKDTDGKNDKEQDIIVYDTDENTVEEESENGLKESDSEDGPVLNENTMLDFNGTANVGDNNVSDSNAQTENNDNGNGDEDKDDDAKDTGSWGAFY